MSDGHFNRSLLPRTDYQSGVRTGISRTKLQAIKVLENILGTHFPHLEESQRQQIIDQFKSEINS